MTWHAVCFACGRYRAHAHARAPVQSSVLVRACARTCFRAIANMGARYLLANVCISLEHVHFTIYAHEYLSTFVKFFGGMLLLFLAFLLRSKLEAIKERKRTAERHSLWPGDVSTF